MIVSEPEIMLGKPRIAGTRTTVNVNLQRLPGGRTKSGYSSGTTSRRANKSW